jgi:mannose-6-phosphate isomerase-like protein (cupin superfamily)
MPYVESWHDLPEVEVLPGNFRRSAAGQKSSVNRIRMVHPSSTPLHHHDEEEQMVMMVSGEMDVTIGEEVVRLQADQVCVIPPGTRHRFQSVAGECVFLETFAPPRYQNLVGYLGKVF